MIGLNIHNVTVIEEVRVHDSNDGSGWITISVGAEPHCWNDTKQPTISNEITFFLKDKDSSLQELQDKITLAIAKNRREMVEAKEKKEKEGAEETEETW